MSFQDLESGSNGPPSSTVAAGIFQITTAVTAFRRLVDAIGTAKDTPDHRRKLQETRSRIAQLARNTSDKLKALTDATRQSRTLPSRKAAEEAKLARDFQAVLQEFQKVQHLAAEREAVYTPTQPPSSLSNSSASEERARADDDQESRMLLWEQKRQEVISLDNEVAFNEAIIDEREQGIKDIQYDVGQVNEIYKDLAVLLHDQRSTIDEIDVHIEKASNSTSQAKTQLHKLSKSSKSRSSWSCWLLIIFVVVLVILLLVLIIH